ncbi:MAG: helix-turn-helix transcriptional regulator [Ruminococcaceae bacterium]|nr:helix-turn-helix transcriptional regulator [Oscillospiraceae bacterium]
MINTSKLAQRIADARREKGLTQRELAARVGVSAQAVSKWERGIACPDISILDELAGAIGLSLPELLGVDQT